MNMKRKDDDKMFKFISDNRVLCKCGHSLFIRPDRKVICSWCGELVLGKRIKFKETLMKKLEEV